jgi:two-component system cell cycle sensor histidine kinase/response regulator CckA
VYANPAAERTSGYTRPELIGRNPRIVKSGRQDTAFYHAMWMTLRAGSVWTGRFANRRKDGRLYEEVATISPMVDAAGRITHFVAVKRDVTREVELEQQFRQAQKMEVIGRLAGGVAHDFNNLLTAIIGFSNLIIEDVPPGHPHREWAEEVQKAGHLATALTRQLLAFSRKQVLQPQVIDLNDVVTSATRMMGRLLGQDVRLVSRLANPLGRVKADLAQIEQVLLNLAVNARDAMPTGGTLTVTTVNVRCGEDEDAGLEAGAYVELAMSDTGVGMTDDVKSHLFEPFFTTKEQGKGTGLGLATVYGIVKQSGGSIRVESELGLGTTFRILLPQTADTAATESRPPETPGPRRAGIPAAVLVVDVNQGPRRFVSHCLREAGCTVLEAESGAEALQAAHRFEGDIDLLVADDALPDLTAHQLRQLLAPRRPAMKLLLMLSGLRPELSVEHVSGPGTAFIQKPFGSAALTEALHTVLRPSGGP